MTNLWDEATRDHDAERDSMLRSAAKITTARWWPFLAEAATERSFGHRLAVVKGDVLAALKEAGVTSARFQEEALEGLAEDFRVLHASRREAFWGGKDKGKPDPGPGFDPTTWTLARLELAMADLPIATWWDDAKKSAIKAAYDAKRGLTPATAAAEFVVCPDCNGTGAVPAGGWEDEDDVDNGLKQCPTCKGEGEVPARTAVRRTANRPGSTQRGARALRGSTVTWADGSRTGTVVELAPLDSPPHPVKGRWGDVVTERTRAISKDYPAKEIEACWVSSEGQMVWASVHVPTMKVLYSVETAQQVFSSRKTAAVEPNDANVASFARGLRVQPEDVWAVIRSSRSAWSLARSLRIQPEDVEAIRHRFIGKEHRPKFSAIKESADSGWTGMDAIDEGGLFAGQCAQGSPNCNWGWAKDGKGREVYRCSVHGTEQAVSHTRESTRTGTHRGNPYRDSTPSWEEYRAGKAAFRAGAPEPSEDPVEEALIWSDDMDPSLIMAGSKGWPEMPKMAESGWTQATGSRKQASGDWEVDVYQEVLESVRRISSMTSQSFWDEAQVIQYVRGWQDVLLDKHGMDPDEVDALVRKAIDEVGPGRPGVHLSSRKQAAARPRDPDLEDDLREREDMARERSRARTDAEEDALDNELDDIDQRRRRASRRTASLTKCGSCGGIATAGDRVECLDCGEVAHRRTAGVMDEHREQMRSQFKGNAEHQPVLHQERDFSDLSPGFGNYWIAGCSCGWEQPMGAPGGPRGFPAEEQALRRWNNHFRSVS